MVSMKPAAFCTTALLAGTLAATSACTTSDVIVVLDWEPGDEPKPPAPSSVVVLGLASSQLTASLTDDPL